MEAQGESRNQRLQEIRNELRKPSGVRSQPQPFLEARVQPATAQSGHKGLGRLRRYRKATKGYIAKEAPFWANLN